MKHAHRAFKYVNLTRKHVEKTTTTRVSKSTATKTVTQTNCVPSQLHTCFMYTCMSLFCNYIHSVLFFCLFYKPVSKHKIYTAEVHFTCKYNMDD